MIPVMNLNIDASQVYGNPIKKLDSKLKSLFLSCDTIRTETPLCLKGYSHRIMIFQAYGELTGEKFYVKSIMFKHKSNMIYLNREKQFNKRQLK